MFVGFSLSGVITPAKIAEGGDIAPIFKINNYKKRSFNNFLLKSLRHYWFYQIPYLSHQILSPTPSGNH